MYFFLFYFFFFNDTATTEIYTLSLHDALPISHALRRFAVELALARGRAEAAFGERREALGHLEPLPALFLERSPFDAPHARARRFERLPADVRVRIAEALLGEAHARGQPPEHFAVRQALAQRLDRGAVRHDVEMPVGGVHVPVLELRRRRQHDVGVVAGVGEKLLVDHGEEVLARESPDDLPRVGRDH